MASPTVYIVRTETILPDIPHSVGVTNPANASTIFLPLSPPDFIPKASVLVWCGGAVVDPAIQAINVSLRFPLTPPCSSATLTGAPEGIARGREVMGMLRVEGRPTPESV